MQTPEATIPPMASPITNPAPARLALGTSSSTAPDQGGRGDGDQEQGRAGGVDRGGAQGELQDDACDGAQDDPADDGTGGRRVPVVVLRTAHVSHPRTR